MGTLMVNLLGRNYKPKLLLNIYYDQKQPKIKNQGS